MSTLSLPTLTQKLYSLAKAMTSGKDLELQAERDAICNGCDKFQERAVRTVTGKFKIEGHCKVCGCGAKNIADIYKGKHARKNMQCPELKWPGDAESKGISLHDANTLFTAREGLEYSIALLEHYIAKDKPLRGSAEMIYDAHYQLTPASEHEDTNTRIRKVLAKLKFYHKVVQVYIDEARPLDPAILAQVRGRPQQKTPAKQPPKTNIPARPAILPVRPSACCQTNKPRTTPEPVASSQ